MSGVKVKDSKIEGKGLFADKEFNEGEIIGIAHINGVPTEVIGNFHNHSETPNAHSVAIGNKRYLAALKPLMKGEEITIDYRRQPELEQPEEFRKGGLVKMPKPSKKGLASKKYTKSLTGTNRLFTKNSLFEKPKSKKNRVYDPKAKYYAEGGESEGEMVPESPIPDALNTARTFNEAFKIARSAYGPNQIFEWQGRKYGTNLAGEEFKPSEEVLTNAGLNVPAVKENLNKENSDLNNPFVSKSTVKLEQDPYKDWNDIKQKNLELNMSVNADKIVNYKNSTGGDKNYIIVDKKKGLMHVYQPGNSKPLFTSPVDLGASVGDAQTVTKIKDKNGDGIIDSKEAQVGAADFDKGNKSTGAGKYYISNIDPEGYGGLPLFNMMNESQYNNFLKTGKVDNVATSIHKGFIPDDNSRVSNGCIRCNKTTLDNLTKYLQNSSEVYILPEDPNNEFVIENDQLNFKVKNKSPYFTYKNNGKVYKKENGAWYAAPKIGDQFVKITEIDRIKELNKNATNAGYNFYEDSKGNVQKGQGVNLGSTLNYVPIKAKLDKEKFINDKFTYFDFSDDQELEVVNKFVNSLEKNKQKAMKVAKINGDVYNDIAQIAFGIFGTESNFADTHSAAGNLARAAQKYLNPQGSSSPDYKSKYSTYGASEKYRSVGLTQIRWNYLNDDEKKALKSVGITSNSDFLDPTKAALGTTIVLGIRYNQQLTDKEKKDIWTSLPKKWNSRDNYADRVLSNSKYLTLEQKVTNKTAASKKDKWGRPSTSKWYGFNPKTKKYEYQIGGAVEYQDGGEPGDKFKKRLMKRNPGMQGVYGPEGENLNIVKDPNYDAASKPYYAGDIEFMFPGLPQVSYANKVDSTLPDYVYANPSPDKYTSVYNPRGANRADIFLDMLHGMRDDQNYEVLLQNFDKAVRDARGGDMQYYYEQDVANNNYTDGQEQWDDNYVDGQLRAQLAPGTLGMFSHGRRDYRKERRHDSPEMKTAAKDIRNYLKGEYQKGGSKTQFYTVKGSDGVYRKVNDKWEVDWNRSGKFQPLSEGDIAKRASILNSQAKVLYDPMYDDIYTTSQSAYTSKPKSAPAKKLTPQDQAAQKAFETTFSVKPQGEFEWDAKQLSDIRDDSDAALIYLENWQKSPMYKQMLRNSVEGEQSSDDNYSTYDVYNISRGMALNEINTYYADGPSDDTEAFSQTTGSPGIAGQSLGNGIVMFYPKNQYTTRQIELPLHEYSHATDENGLFIPQKDRDLINSFKTDLKNTRGYINKSGESMDDAALKQLQGNYDYITDPTETRARLNALRYLGKQTGVYDPFTEKMDLEKFKMLNKANSYFDPYDPNWDGNQPLQELRDVYTDEEIIKMLNTISKNDGPQEELNVAAKGGEPKKRKERFVEGTYDPNETAGYMLTEDEVVVPGQASAWGKARNQYKEQHPEEKFIERKKKQYLKRNPGLNKIYGVSMDNFPENVEENFRNEYDYRTNTAVVKKVGKKEGWNPNQREQYIDDLNDTQRSIVADSKYGSKLQPGYWNRALAGVQELGNTLLPGQPFQYNIPGLTKKEQKEMRDSKLSAFEVLAPMDIPGAAIANFVKNRGLSTGSDYKQLPGLLSGEKMENVTDMEAMAFNPLTYAGIEALPETAVNLAKGTYKLGKTGINALETGYEAAKVNPQSWFQTPEQLIENPNLYRTIKGETTWKDPLGKLNKFVDDSKIKSSLKRENELIGKYPGFENRKVRIPLQQEEQNLRYAIEKAAEERNLRRSRVPIKPILTQHGTHLGGGQGRLYMNTLNPEEVVKIGTLPGSSDNLTKLIETGKNLEGMPSMENVAFPTKGFTLYNSPTSIGNSHVVQFMPWKGNPLNADNPVNTPFKFGIPSDKAKRELQFMAQTLDDNKVGIDYIGQNNMMYDPVSDSYKLVDLNYIDDPKKAWSWNELDKPVKQRIEDNFGYTIPEGEIPLELEFANSKSIKPLLGDKIGDNTGRFNLGVHNFKDYPQYIAKVEDPAAVAATQGLDAEQYMKAMVDRTKNLDRSEFSKVFRTIEGKEGKRILVMPKLRGTLGSKLDNETLMSIPDQSYADFYDKLKLLRDEGLNYDFYGDNFMYDPYTEKFNLFDFSPQNAIDVEPGYGNKQFFETEVFGRGNPNIYGKEQAGRNLKDALAKRLTRTYMESFPNDQEVHGLDEYNKRITDILRDLSPQKYGGIHNWF